MAARAVIKDVGRVMDLPYAMVDNIAKMIPQKVGVTIDSAMNGDADRDIKPNAEFKALYEADETVQLEQIMLRLRSLKVLLWNIWDC